jgi:magnesium-transporting ATPase (P-type)
VLLSSRDFFVNQALLTGESFPVEKHGAQHGDPAAEISEAGNVALAGTSVISGSFEIGLRRFSTLILRITLVRADAGTLADDHDGHLGTRRRPAVASARDREAPIA